MILALVLTGTALVAVVSLLAAAAAAKIARLAGTPRPRALAHGAAAFTTTITLAATVTTTLATLATCL
ncbi:hypothetical protein [Embleya sp. NPDC020886]|uniref:hypothetical protein n=1 Tax=Embleya sp. NPDC020886 TaxID=3363980 RepID=UPI0037AB1DC4